MRRLPSLLLMAALGAGASAWAQDFPNRPIKLIVGLAPGGASDTLARLLGKELGERLGQTIVVENKPGAGGNLASELVANATPDGYTLLYTADNHNVNSIIYPKAGYDPVKDFKGVIRVSEYSLILSASARSPFRSIKDVVAAARKDPGKHFYGSSGIGLPNHVAMEKFNQAADIRITHVAYKGSSQSIKDAVAGQVPLVMSTITAAQGFYGTGQLFPLAVTGASRWASLPQVPTMKEAGFPNATSSSWMGIVAPRATPQPVIERLNTELQAILREPEILERFQKLGMGVGGGTAKQFDEFLARDLASHRVTLSKIQVKVE